MWPEAESLQSLTSSSFFFLKKERKEKPPPTATTIPLCSTLIKARIYHTFKSMSRAASSSCHMIVSTIILRIRSTQHRVQSIINILTGPSKSQQDAWFHFNYVKVLLREGNLSSLHRSGRGGDSVSPHWEMCAWADSFEAREPAILSSNF